MTGHNEGPCFLRGGRAGTSFLKIAQIPLDSQLLASNCRQGKKTPSAYNRRATDVQRLMAPG